MLVYASVVDLESLFRPLKENEKKKASDLLEIISSTLRVEATKVGKNLDQMVSIDEDLANIAKSVTVDVASRYLNTNNDQEPMTQVSQSALGYSFSGTYLVPGGGIYIKKSELSRLGLRKQRLSGIEM